MFRLAHISDIHLAPMPVARPGELASKRLLGYLNWHLGGRKLHHSREILEAILVDLKARKPDHLAITGDIVNISLKQEFADATRFLEANFQTEEATLILGNHDAYVPGSANKAIAAWKQYMGGEEQGLLSAKQYPLVRRTGNMALVCVNSAIATAPFMATGYVGRKQAQRLRDLLGQLEREGLCRIVLIHHPPVHAAAVWYKRLKGIGRFQEAIKSAGAELILHGHTHLPTQLEIDGKNGPVPVIGVASASYAHGFYKPPARYNLFSIHKTNAKWSIVQEEFGLDKDPDHIGFIARHKLA